MVWLGQLPAPGADPLSGIAEGLVIFAKTIGRFVFTLLKQYPEFIIGGLILLVVVLIIVAIYNDWMHE